MSQRQNRKASFTQNRMPKSGSNRIRQDSGQSSSIKSRSGSNKRESLTYQSYEAGSIAGLPEFCATCERQLISPDSSILYCSEACRKKDASFRPLAIQTTLLPSANTRSMASNSTVPEPDIVPQRSPTVLRPPSDIFSDISTEPDSPIDRSDESESNTISEASRYLAQFYSQAYTAERVPSQRPRASRINSATEGPPSLSHTPSSSIGTAASIDKPLPRRHELSTSRFSSKSVDLVVPSYPNYSPSEHFTKDASMSSSASTVTAVRVAEEPNKSYERRNLSGDDHRETSSGLKQLFSYESVKALPKQHRIGNFQWVDEGEPHRDATTGL